MPTSCFQTEMLKNWTRICLLSFLLLFALVYVCILEIFCWFFLWPSSLISVSCWISATESVTKILTESKKQKTRCIVFNWNSNIIIVSRACWYKLSNQDCNLACESVKTTARSSATNMDIVDEPCDCGWTLWVWPSTQSSTTWPQQDLLNSGLAWMTIKQQEVTKARH